jgi:RNA polymerase sigma-70 factor (ECF subfamily)
MTRLFKIWLNQTVPAILKEQGVSSDVNKLGTTKFSTPVSPSEVESESAVQADRLDEDAYVQLIEQAKSRGRMVIRRILMSEADVEDALQEACINAYVKLHTFDGRAKFSTWFTRIAINTALQTLRKRRHSREISLSVHGDGYGSVLNSLIDPHPNPQELLNSQEERRLLRESIDNLPETLKSALQTRLQGDLNVADIAARLGISIPATKSRLRRATMILAKKSFGRGVHKTIRARDATV